MTFVRFFLLLVGMTLLLPATSWPSHAQDFELKHDHQSATQEQTTEYVCPMHSHIVSDEPGSCPICGMDLEPRQRATQVQVRVSEQMQQNLGIRTESVSYDTLWRYLPTVASVQWNENAQHHIHSRAPGWIEKLSVRSEGQKVQQGDQLYAIYSRDLVVAQQDLLQALNSTANPRLLSDAKLRLEL